jgi:imidazolonepropionase
MNTTLVRGASQLLTLRGTPEPRRGDAMLDLGLVKHGAVLVRGETVLAAGEDQEIEKLSEARDAREIDAAGGVIMPGFVDSHTHLIFGSPRLHDYEMLLTGASYAEIAAAGGGILRSVEAVRSSPARDLETQARTSLAGMARHGTTTVEAKSGYGLDEVAEIKTLRLLAKLDGDPLEIVPTYLGAHVVPPEYRDTPDRYVAWMCEHMLPLVAGQNLAQFADVYCEEGTFTLEQARRYLERARAVGLAPRVHAEQFTRTGAVRLAVDVEAASADHLDSIDEAGMHALGGSNTIATLLPGAVFHLGLPRYAPTRALIKAGAAVALATDFNPGTSPTYNMQMIVSLACSQMRMTPAEAIAAATINGAHALRRAGRIGSLEPGKQADLIVLGVSDYREIPYSFGVNNVRITMKRGNVIP